MANRESALFFGLGELLLHFSDKIYSVFVMKNKPLIFEELVVWLRGRFTLTNEEKIWILFILIICWAGLVSRYFYLRNQPPPQPIEADRSP